MGVNDKPAEAQGLNTENAEVNIDELAIELLVICSKESGLKSTATFLTRRGWNTVIKTSVAAGIEYISEKKPDYVLISINHSSPSIAKLPDLILQTFKTPCIGFAELGDALTVQRLNSIRMPHKIFGKPSGPNFQRSIRRILAQRFNVEDDSKSGDGKQKPGDGSNRPNAVGSVKVKGGKSSVLGGKDVHKVSGGSVSEQQSELDDPQDQSFSFDQESEAKPRGMAYMPDHTRAESDGDQVAFSPDRSSTNANQGSVSSTQQRGATLDQPDDADGAGGLAVLGGESKAGGRTHSGPKKRLRDIMPQATETAPGGMESSVSADAVAKLKQALLSAESEAPAGGGVDGEMSLGSPLAAAEATTKSKSQLESAIEVGLQKVCDSKSVPTAKRLHDVGRMAVFTLSTAEFSGYLLMAFESGHFPDSNKFLEDCKKSVVRSLSEMQVSADLEEGFWLERTAQDFSLFTDAKSEFSFRVNHIGMEIGVALFRLTEAPAKIEPASQAGMYVVDLKHITTDTPVSFRAYLYFEVNQKYFMYLRAGRQLHAAQKERLAANKVANFFLNEADLVKFKGFCANQFFDSLEQQKKSA